MRSPFLSPPAWHLRATLALIAAFCVPHAALLAQTRKPIAPLAIRNARLVGGEAVSIITRDGRIQSVLEPGSAIPIDAHPIDATGLVALPAFIDAYTIVGCPARAPEVDRDLPTDVGANIDIDMRDANRKGVQPSYTAAAVAKWTPEQRAGWRKGGFGHALVAPFGQILCGDSALLSLREAATRDAIVVPAVFAHAGFETGGAGYPSTAMGYVAQLRQFFLDARRHAELHERYQAGRPGVRPAWDADLDSFQPVLRRGRRIAARAERANEIDRWLDLSEELGFELVVVGGREAFHHAERLSARRVPVVLTCEWGEEVELPKAVPAGERPRYDVPAEVRLEQRRKWEERRSGALVLQRAGVAIAFGSASGAPAELFGRVRKLVELGLPIEVARQALGEGAAQLLGVERRIGRLAAGQETGIALWTADPLDPANKSARLRWIVLDGAAEEFVPGDGLENPPAPGVDLGGKWTLALVGEGAGPKLGDATLWMELDGSLRGTVLLRERADGEAKGGEIKGKVGGKQARLSGKLGAAADDPPWTIDLKWKEGRWSGEFKAQLSGASYEASVEFTQVHEHVEGCCEDDH